MNQSEPNWLRWGRELQSIAQNGLAYCQNLYDIERYEAMRHLAAEMLASQTVGDPAVIEDLFKRETGYATPKVDVRGALFRGDKILLVREIIDQGRWTLPGGWADVSDSPSEAVIREIREETGFEARTLKLAAVYDRNRRGHPYYYFTIYKFFFLCEITGGAPIVSYETGGVDFFSVDQLPELSLSRVTPDEIQMLFEHLKHPEFLTEFD